MNGKKIGETGVVHHALHGYDGGHRLLASSCEIDRAAQRIMLPLSDSSGSGAQEGFSEYLTCYPLSDASCQAFAKTWHAPEMRRPGCVWTHTLFLSFADLAILKSVSGIRKLFSRPQDGGNYDFYQKPFDFSDLELTTREGIETDADEVAELLKALYVSCDVPVVVLEDASYEHEELVLAVWAQQWPRLRRQFSFCTGAFRHRTIDGDAFDLQVAPVEQKRSFQRTEPSAVLLHFADGNSKNTLTRDGIQDVPWLRTPVRDILQPDDELSEYLWTFGADVPGTRESFKGLTEILQATRKIRQNQESFDKICQKVSSYFPTKERGKKLKRALFGPEPRMLSVDERCVLFTLLRTPSHSAFDFGALCVRKRIRRLLKTSSGSIKWELYRDLAKRQLNEPGHNVLCEFEEELTTVDILSSWSFDVEVFKRLVSRNPGIAEQAATWKADCPIQHTVVDTLVETQQLTTEAGARILWAMIQADSSEVASRILRALGPEVLESTLEVASRSSEKKESVFRGSWSENFSKHPDAVAHWLQSAEDVDLVIFSSMAPMLEPQHACFTTMNTKRWHELLDQWQCVHDSASPPSTVAAFVLAWVVSHAPEPSSSLISRVFGTVYTDVMRSALDERCWRWLERELTKGKWFSWFWWDYGEMLREGIVDLFIENAWPGEDFRNTIEGLENRERFIGYARSRRGGKRLLKEADLLGSADREQ